MSFSEFHPQNRKAFSVRMHFLLRVAFFLCGPPLSVVLMLSTWCSICHFCFCYFFFFFFFCLLWNYFIILLYYDVTLLLYFIFYILYFIFYILLSIIYYLLSIIYYLLSIIYYLFIHHLFIYLFICFDTHMWNEYKRKLLGIPTIVSHMMLLRYDN